LESKSLIAHMTWLLSFMTDPQILARQPPSTTTSLSDFTEPVEALAGPVDIKNMTRTDVSMVTMRLTEIPPPWAPRRACAANGSACAACTSVGRRAMPEPSHAQSRKRWDAIVVLT
jgi:hypothetical protein